MTLYLEDKIPRDLTTRAQTFYPNSIYLTQDLQNQIEYLQCTFYILQVLLAEHMYPVSIILARTTAVYIHYTGWIIALATLHVFFGCICVKCRHS